jgi:hypothetical protein
MPQIRTRTLPVSDSIAKVSPSATTATLRDKGHIGDEYASDVDPGQDCFNDRG